MLFIHILAGTFGVASGFAAMAFTKGSHAHRVAGNVYAGSMLVMSLAAFIVAVFFRPNHPNIHASSIIFYLVASAWLTMHRDPEHPGALEYVSMLIGAAAVVLGVVLGANAEHRAFAAISYTFSAITALAVAADVRLALGRSSLTRTRRLVRHVWRMGLTFFVATASLFLGQAKILPAWLTGSRLNVLISVASISLLVFWLIRVRFAPWSRRPRPDGRPLATAR